jgi:hypothetical protein
MLRRGFIRLLPAAFLGRNAYSALEVERMLKDYPLTSARTQTRRYRADAAVMFLGLTVVRRQNVGGGSVQFEELHADNAKRTGITFKAGSLPSRARGLNRLGYIQEVCVEENSHLREAAYFGFMTSSPEESFADAKSALEKQGEEGLKYTAINGAVNAGAARSASHHWIFPSEYDWSKCDSLVETARQKTGSADPQWKRLNWGAGATPATFLNAVLQAARAASPRSETVYIFGEKRYKLVTDKARESNGVTRLNGEILNESTGKKTNFSVWFESASELPLRIEFQARSYLKLTFEAV